MTVLEKFTLYDFCGYVVPGSFLMICTMEKWLNIKCFQEIQTIPKDIEILTIVAFLIFAYALGMAISELAKIVAKLFRFLIEIIKIKGITECVQRILGVSSNDKEVISVLKQTGVWDTLNDTDDKVRAGMTYIYSDIQTDSRYTRIHNYASTALMCKNMALTSLICAVLYLFVDKEIQAGILFFVLAALFARRRKRLTKRKEEYTLCWFRQKYKSDIISTKNEVNE